MQNLETPSHLQEGSLRETRYGGFIGMRIQCAIEPSSPVRDCRHRNIARRGDPLEAIHKTWKQLPSWHAKHRHSGHLQSRLILQPYFLEIEDFLNGRVSPQSDHVITASVYDPSSILRKDQHGQDQYSRSIVWNEVPYIRIVPVDRIRVDTPSVSGDLVEEVLPGVLRVHGNLSYRNVGDLGEVCCFMVFRRPWRCQFPDEYFFHL